MLVTQATAEAIRTGTAVTTSMAARTQKRDRTQRLAKCFLFLELARYWSSGFREGTPLYPFLLSLTLFEALLSEDPLVYILKEFSWKFYDFRNKVVFLSHRLFLYHLCSLIAIKFLLYL